jgi:HSP20 family protein
MKLILWNPRKEMENFSGHMNRLFNRDLLPSTWAGDEVGLKDWHPAVDVYDKEDRIVIKAELPGVDKKDVSVDLKDRVLTIKGERKAENEVKEEKYYRRERSFGKFQRSFHVPAQVDADKIEAEFNDGILKVEIPKPEKHKPKKINVH